MKKILDSKNYFVMALLISSFGLFSAHSYGSAQAYSGELPELKVGLKSHVNGLAFRPLEADKEKYHVNGITDERKINYLFPGKSEIQIHPDFIKDMLEAAPKDVREDFLTQKSCHIFGKSWNSLSKYQVENKNLKRFNGVKFVRVIVKSKNGEPIEGYISLKHVEGLFRAQNNYCEDVMEVSLKTSLGCTLDDCIFENDQAVNLVRSVAPALSNIVGQELDENKQQTKDLLSDLTAVVDQVNNLCDKNDEKIISDRIEKKMKLLNREILGDLPSGFDETLAQEGLFPVAGPQAIVGGIRVDSSDFHPHSGSRTHRGIDLAVVKSPIVSPVEGHIVQIFYQPGGAGCSVVVEDDRGYRHQFFHLYHHEKSSSDHDVCSSGAFSEKIEEVYNNVTSQDGNLYVPAQNARAGYIKDLPNPIPVKRGEHLGFSGNSGRTSTFIDGVRYVMNNGIVVSKSSSSGKYQIGSNLNRGYHLHFEIKKKVGGEYRHINPAPYLRSWRRSADEIGLAQNL